MSQGVIRSRILMVLAISLAGGMLAVAAQDAPFATTPAVPASGPATDVSPETGATRPTTNGNATRPLELTTQPATAPGKLLLSLNFRDASVDAVLEHLSEVAGFVVVKEAPVNGRVTVLSKRPVTPDEAVALLDSVLKPDGLTAIRMGKIHKITSRDKAKKSNIPVHVGADPALIEPTDELVTQVIPLRSVDAVKLKTDLAPLISTDADLSANAASNSLMLTDTMANIRRVVEIVHGLDQRESSESSLKVRHLKYADAVAAAKLITDVFKPEEAANANVPPQFAFFRGFRPPGGPQQQPAEEKGNTGKIVASADQRTNTVVVTGPSDTLKVIDEMLNEIDSDPSSEQTFFIYAVKNGQSQDMALTLNTLFGNPTNGQTPNRSTNGTTNTFGNFNSGANNRSSSSFGLGSGGNGPFGGGGGLNSGGSSPFGSGNNTINRGGNNNPFQSGGNPAAANNVSSATVSAAAALIGQVYVVADTDTNSLLVATATKFQERVKEIIAELDRPVPQVLIKVLIAEVTHDNSTDIGTDFSVLNTRASGKGQDLISNLGNQASQAVNGGLAVGLVESNVTAVLHALATENKLDVLSRPYILASDNQIATITIGQEVPIITGSQTTQLGLVNNTITYTQVGIILNVTPHINPEGLVILDVSPEVSQLTSQTVEVSTGVNAPVFDNRAADTRVGIRDGQTIVIGGMMQDQKTSAVNKIPILGDIPGIGVLFQKKKVDKTKTELLIFLTPHVAQQADRLRPMSQDEMRGLRLTPDAVQRGTFQEHMEGMQRGGLDHRYPPLEVPPPTTQPHGFAEPPLPGTRGPGDPR